MGRRLRLDLAAALVAGLLSAALAPWAWATARTPAQPVHTDFYPAAFPETPKIDNTWLPLTPGMQFIFKGQASQGGAPLPHEVIFTVTDLTKVINGVRTVVLWDRDISEGEVVEAELAFHAQDANGTVWNLGEYPEEFDAGAFVGAPNTWLAGVAGAQAGIAMRADPRVGTPPYLQGLAPAIEFEDQGIVAKQGEQVCVPAGCYGNVLVIDETNLRAPGEGHQLKLHAPNVGVVRIDPGQGSQDMESLVLTEIRRLNDKEMATARAQALRLDRRAYRFAADVYKDSPRAARFPPVPTDVPAGL
jgi:hypothetical protein